MSALSVLALASDNCSGVITVTWSAHCNQTDSSMQDALTENGDPKVVKHGLKMISLDGRHHYSAVRQLEVEGGYVCTECLLHVIQVIFRDGQAVGQGEAIKSWGTKNTSSAIVRRDH